MVNETNAVKLSPVRAVVIIGASVHDVGPESGVGVSTLKSSSHFQGLT